MSPLTQVLLWCPIQVTVLAFAALGVGSLFGRRRPAAGATVAVAALLAVAGLTVTAFAPWPAWGLNWERLPWSHAAAASSQQAKPPGPETLNKFSISRLDDDFVDLHARADDPSQEAAVSISFWSRARTFLTGNWIGILAALYCVGLVLMLIRIALGFCSWKRRNISCQRSRHDSP